MVETKWWSNDHYIKGDNPQFYLCVPQLLYYMENNLRLVLTIQHESMDISY